MFVMKIEEVVSEITKINDYLGKCLWMDFEFCRMDDFKVVMAGSIDQSYEKYAIEISFEQPYFVSSLFYWQTDTSKPFIQLANDVEAMGINTKYKVEVGNYIFKINIEDFEESPIFVAAKKVTCNILNENPFPK